MPETPSPKSRRTTIGRRTKSKTRSDTKASDLKPPSAGRVYFLDESIAGHRLIQVMRDAGANVVPLFDEFERGTPDPVWLPVITSRGWILLTKDSARGDDDSDSRESTCICFREQDSQA